MRHLQSEVKVLEDSVDLTPTEGQTPGARLTRPTGEKPVVGEPRLRALAQLAVADESAQGVIIGNIINLEAADRLKRNP